jgi:hypothetical protein
MEHAEDANPRSSATVMIEAAKQKDGQLACPRFPAGCTSLLAQVLTPGKPLLYANAYF